MSDEVRIQEIVE